MRLATATCCLSVLVLFVGTVVDAAIVYQQTASHVDANGNAFLAWEAETFASTTVRTPADSAWTSTADASAVGGQALLATTGSGTGGATSNIVTYDFQFVKAGTYSLYWSGRANATPVGGNDGWFAPAGGFGDTEPARRVNGYSNDDLVRLGGTSGGDNYATTYQWFGQGGDTNARIDFTVSAAHVTNGDTLSLSVATREDGLMIDRWILSENSTLFGSTAGDTAAELDAFPTATTVPPPTLSVPLGIVNPSFEIGTAPFEGASGWTISPSDEFYTTAGSGLSGGDPNSGVEGPGSQFLTGNRLATGDDANPASSLATQSLDISAYASDIDAGSATVSLDFFYSMFDGNESSSVSIEFFDAGNGSLGSLATGALAATAANAWVSVNLSGAVPANARTFLLQLDASRGSGTATNVSFDNFSGTLDGLTGGSGAIPEPSTFLIWSLGLIGLAAYARRRRTK